MRTDDRLNYMGNGNTGGYTVTAVALHWATAVLIAIAFALGEYVEDLALSPVKLRLISYHKWIGVTVFSLASLRLYWRFTHPAPAFPPRMPSWERAAAKAAHVALYALILITPVAGWLSSSAHGFKTVYLGLLPIPDLLGKDKALSEGLEIVHSLLNKAIFFIVIAHAGAALKHHFLDRDEVLRRMLGLRGLLAAPLLLLALSAGADAQSALREGSSIEFVSKQMGVPVTGIFREFEADVRFYPGNPGKSRAAVIINADSIDAGSDEATSEIKRRVWLDTKNHPRAEFSSASLTPDGPGQYTVKGRITIKGKTQNVSAPFTVREGKGHWVFEGRFVLNRLDFNIGEGEWADTDTVDDEVEVTFRLHVPFEGSKKPI